MALTHPAARSALQVASWRDEIGDLRSEDLVGLALDALVGGLDGPALVELAGTDSWDVRGMRDLWKTVLAEQGFEPVGEQTALWLLVRHTAACVVGGSLDPLAGAQWLWRPASDRMEPEGDLRIFGGLASEAEDHPEDRSELSDRAVKECELLLARQHPRCWLRLQAGYDHVLSGSTTAGQSRRGLADLAIPDDLAARLSEWRDTWRETVDNGGHQDWPSIYPFYAAIMAEGKTYAFPEGQTLHDARPWWMEQPPGQTVVAIEDDAIVGSAKMGANRPGRGAHLATASFLVDPAHHNRGVGRALGQYVIDWACSAGFKGIQFNAVVESNEAAVHLWQALGYDIVGTAPASFDHPEHGLVGLHMMFRHL